MASLKYDTELISNHVAAVPVAARSSFSAFLHPKTRRPVVLGISNQEKPVLELISEDDQGHRHLTDFGKRLGIPDGTVQCFAAQQNSDLDVYLVVAFKYTAQESKIVILKPFSLASAKDPSKLEVRTMPTVESFYMGPVADDGEWPLVIAAHKRLDRMSGGSDLSRIFVYGSQWQELRSFQLPENADEAGILDICAGANTFGKGLWVLYKVQNKISLVGEFAYMDDNKRITYQFVRAKCPQGTSAIVSCIDSTQQTSLLIGAAEGLHLLTSHQSVRDNQDATLVSKGDIFQSPLQMQIAQDGSDFTVWSVNQNGQLGYARVNIDDDAIDKLQFNPVLLTDMHQTASFATTISQKDKHSGHACVSQSLISNDDSGNLSLLQQNTDTGIWKKEPFVIADNLGLYEVKSYSIAIAATTATGEVVVNGSVKVTSDSTLQAWVNGRPTTISSLGTRLPLDAHGELNLIVPTQGVGGRVLAIEDLQSQNKSSLSLKKTTIDPSSKVMDAFAFVKADTDLTTLKTKSGRQLYSTAEQRPSAADLKQAAMCFEKFHQATKEVKSDQGTAPMAAMAAPAASGGLDSIGEFFMDGFHWLGEKLHEAEEWFVEKIGHAWTFVCKLAGEATRFVLDCAEKIGEALTWVWKKIKLGIDLLIEFAGFLFNWPDIKATKNTISGLLNATIAYGQTKIKSCEDNVERFFDGLEKQIDQSMSAGSTSAISNNNGSGQEGSTSEALNSVGYKWMGERLKNGGAATGTSMTNTVNHKDFEDAPSFGDILAPLGESVSKLVVDMCKDIGDLFHQNHGVSNQEIWSKLGKDFLIDGLRIIKAVVKGLLMLGEKLISNIGTICNTRIDIPVISQLWKTMTDHDLTLLDATSLILGFMVCMLTKLLAGKAPATFAKLDADFIDTLVSGKASSTVKEDLALMGSIVSLNVTLIIDLVSIIKFAYNITKKGAEETVEKLSPGTAMLAIKSVVSIVGLILAWPTDASVPGSDCRKWAVSLEATTIASDIMFALLPIGGDNSEKISECFNCLIAFINFGLYNAAYAQELDPKAQFPDKDTAISGMGISETVLTTVASAGKCVAVTTIEEQPEVAAVALAVMTTGNHWLAINKGATTKRTIDIKCKTNRGVAPQS